MNREQFFQELRTALHREGFTPQPEQDELLPVGWDGLPLCRITADGGVRYWQEDVATPERERACERATDLACTVREYMTLLEQAPPLQAQSLTGDYRLLADFNGAVLAAHPTRLGVQFVTWDWSFDRTGLNQGNYFQENYAGAKQDFAIRAGLISKQQIFNQEQLIEIYRCCSDTLDAGFDLTAEQEKCIRGIQEQIAIAAPDALDRIREQEQHLMEPYERIAEMPFPEGTPYTDVELTASYPYDPEKAAALLDEAGWVMNEETGIREKDGETLNLTFIYDTAQDSLVSSYATLLKSQLEKVGIGLELKGSEKMEWYAEMMAGNFDITYWIGEYEFSSPHCFFGAMPSMTPHTFSLSQVDGSQEFFDAITAVKQTDDPAEVQELYNYLINYDLCNVIDIPLTYYKDLILYNTDKIAGYEFSGVPAFFDVSGLQPVA